MIPRAQGPPLKGPELKLYLEDAFGRSVDLVTPNSLRPEMRAEIEKEAVLVP